MRRAVALALALAACADEAPSDGADPGQSGRLEDGGPDSTTPPRDGGGPADQDVDPPRADGAPERDAAPVRDAADPERDAAAQDAAEPDPDGAPDCPRGEPCNPFEVNAFPYRHAGDTRRATSRAFDAYACAPDTDESGPEVVYRVEIAEVGLLSARIEEEPRDDADIDVHLLAGEPDPDTCIARDHVALGALVQPGTYFVVVDTWVDADGSPRPGPYTLAVDFRPQPAGDCAFRPERMQMFWRACDAGIEECEQADDGVYLNLPATGPVVKEAHLVTVDDGFGGDWPSSSRDGLERHYALSEAATGYVMARREPWAPEGEGGSMWGQAAYGRPLPVVDEAWYVNMYWRRRPAAGTRMLVVNPANGRAVVAAAGYETGPGANTAIGGVTEEIHDHLGTNHRSTLVLGFPADPDLPLGPIDCPR